MMNLGRQVTLERDELRFTAWVNDKGSGAWVVLLHGFPDEPSTWHKQLPELWLHGYKTLVVTNRGYEPSSICPDNNYQVITLAEDVLCWMDQLSVEKAHLIGHDWGATIAYATAALCPSRVLSLVGLAVPHPGQLENTMGRDFAQLWRSRYVIGFQFKGLAEYRVRRRNYAYIGKLWSKWSPGWDYSLEWLNSIKARISQPGVLSAILTYYRQGADQKSEAGKKSRALSRSSIEVPTLGLVGDNDGCISAAVFEQSMLEKDFPSGVTVSEIPGAGHFLHLQSAELVNKKIIDWLISHKSD